jgi:hypothetical protein
MRIRISKRNSELIDQLTTLYNFKYDGIIARVGFCLSLQLNKKFELLDDTQIGSDGKDWRDERALFGYRQTINHTMQFIKQCLTSTTIKFLQKMIL